MKIKECFNIKKCLEGYRSSLVIKWSLLITIIFIIIFIILLSINFSINYLAKNTFLPKTNISGINVGKLNKEEALNKIETKLDFIKRRGFVYTSDIKTIIIYPTIKAIDKDASYPLISWEIEKSLDNILNLQNNNKLNNPFLKIKTITIGSNYKLLYTWDKEQHLEILENNLNNLLIEKKEASFDIVNDEIKINSEEIGKTFNFQQALIDTELQINNLNN